jgi:hypothetical protein
MSKLSDPFRQCLFQSKNGICYEYKDFAHRRNSGWNIKIHANIHSRKLLVLAKENGSIQPRNAELNRKGVKCTNVQI